MIIAPAILISNLEEFERQLAIYSEFAPQIDFDINVAYDDFKGIVTVELESILKKIKNSKLNYPVLNFHLMVTHPIDYIQMILDSAISFGKVYIHQEADLTGVSLDSYIGITIKAESSLEAIDYYNKFTEVQLMTIETGSQGNPIKPEVLERANWLKQNGFKGSISIDGGVNDKTIELIKRYPIDKLSVGSYFSKASDPKLNYAKLLDLLNS